MEGVPAVPNGLERRSAMSDGAYVTEGWLYKLSSNSMVGKDKFQKRWFMIEHTANGGMLSYCPSPEDRTLSKEPLPLDDILTVCEGFSDKKHSCGLEHCEFQITTERNVLLFRAMSREERDAWVQHLRPSRQGYLLHTKVGPETKKLQTRWFVLKNSRLHCFKSPKDTKPYQTALAMDSAVIKTKAESGSLDEHISDELDFYIHYGDTIHLIRCANQEDRDGWIVDLREAAHMRAPSSFGGHHPAIALPDGGGIDPNSSPRFLSMKNTSMSLKKGARVLSKKMGSATDLVGDTVHASIHAGKSVANFSADVAGGAIGMTSDIAHGAVGMTTKAAHSVGLGHADGDDLVPTDGVRSGVHPLLEEEIGEDDERGLHQKIVNPMAAADAPPVDPMAGSKKTRNPMDDMEDDEDDDSAQHVDSGGPMSAPPPVIALPSAGGAADAAAEAVSDGVESLQLQDGDSGLHGSFQGGHSAASTDVGELSRRESRIDSDLLEIPYHELELDKKIGRGSFGEVHKCHWRGTTIAVKVLTDQALSEETLTEFRTEVNMMNKVRHPNVVLLMGICSTPPHLSIITEYLARGSLYRLLHHTQVTLEFRRRLKMGIDISKGMAYLHSASPAIVHRDLKSPNLLVDENFTVKICDFGLARFKENTFVQTINGCAGTPNWMAPEVLRNEKFDEKADVFSMGVILWELIMRREPYKGMQPLQVIAAVVFQGKRLPQPSKTDPRLCALIDKCWAENPEHRPSYSTIQDILQGLFAESVHQAQSHSSSRKVTTVIGKQ